MRTSSSSSSLHDRRSVGRKERTAGVREPTWNGPTDFRRVEEERPVRFFLRQRIPTEREANERERSERTQLCVSIALFVVTTMKSADGATSDSDAPFPLFVQYAVETLHSPRRFNVRRLQRDEASTPPKTHNVTSSKCTYQRHVH